jgi:transcriptional regulator with GAF, ATPase, and Fis domain
MQALQATLERVAGTDAVVLVLGETGTGKEAIAVAIHRMSARGVQPLVRVNCAALPPTLVESELFGREKGAYTGALSEQVGRFEAAHGGTLFLDEVGELPIELQGKLLRVLQSGEFERLGTARTQHVDVRIIASTNRDLEEAVAHGSFRADLYYRLNVFPVRVPPLRERLDDLRPLVWALLEELGERMGRRIESIPAGVFSRLEGHLWPGNVRELRNLLERALILAPGTTLELRHLAFDGDEDVQDHTLTTAIRHHLLVVLERCDWRVRGSGGAAELLGLHEATLRSMMKRLRIGRPAPPTAGGGRPRRAVAMAEREH